MWGKTLGNGSSRYCRGTSMYHTLCLSNVKHLKKQNLEDIMKDPWLNMNQEEVLRPYSEASGGDMSHQVTEIMDNLGLERTRFRSQ